MAGGYQAPANPAPVSGPGALSRRTDGGPAQPIRDLPDPAQYGDGTAFRQQQQAAPLAQVPNVSGPSAGQIGQAAPPAAPVPLTDPTQRPDEHVMTPPAGGPDLSQVGQTATTAIQVLQQALLTAPGNTEIQAFLDQLQGGRL